MYDPRWSRPRNAPMNPPCISLATALRNVVMRVTVAGGGARRSNSTAVVVPAAAAAVASAPGPPPALASAASGGWLPAMSTICKGTIGSDAHSRWFGSCRTLLRFYCALALAARLVS